jgi:holo-[acyl-carrier protein] synthase
MILGIGNDLVDIRRIEAAIERFGTRFTERLYTPEERERCEARVHCAAAYARRFAAKEACAKALGTGFRHGVFWRDMVVVGQPSGQPTLALSGGALRRFEALLPPDLAGRIDLSMSDDPPFAQAVVVISALARTRVAGGP